MFVFTTKFSKRKIICALAGVAAVIVAVVLITSAPPAAESLSSAATVRSNEQRVTYLSSFGWDVEPEPLDEQAVVIPKEFSDVYENYAKLQTAQGFDLSKFAGLEAIRYTYRVLNYPGDDTVVADIIVYRNQVIAGDIQSTALDGFMTGLKKE